MYTTGVINRKDYTMDDINELALEAVTGGTKKPLTLEQRLAYQDDEPTDEGDE